MNEDGKEADTTLWYREGDARTISLLQNISGYFGLAVACIGALVLIGWVYDIPLLKSPSTSFVTVKSSTAVCLVLAGLATLLLPKTQSRTIWNAIRKYCSLVLSVAVAAAGLLVISEFIFGWDSGFAQLLFKEPPGAVETAYPGRMALNTALSFVLAGLGIIITLYKKAEQNAVNQYIALVGIFFSLIALIGYIYGLREFIGLTNLTPVALYTAVAFLLLFGSILLANPQHGPIEIFLGKRAGSLMLRITLPAVLFIVFIFGWLRLLAQKLSSMPPEMRAGLFTVIDLSTIVIALTIIAIIINRLDQRRWLAEEKLHMMNVELEENLQKTHDLLIAMLDHAPALMYVSTPDGKHLMVNEAWAAFNNIDAQQAIGKNYEELFPRQLAEKFRETDRQVIRTGAPVFVERPIYTSNGVRYLNTLKFPLMDKQGRVEAIAGISMDVTERKLSEIKLQESEKLYSSTLSSMLEGVQIVDRGWHYVYLNDAAVMHARTSRDELIGKTMMDAYPGIDGTQMFTSLRRAMESRTASRILNEFEYPDGNKAWFELGIQAVPDGILITSIDVSDRKLAEEKLKNSDIYYRSLIENSTDITLVLDAEGIVQYVSPSAEQLLGFTPEELIGKDIGVFVHPEDYPAADSSLKSAANNPLITIEARLRHKDGSWRTVSARGKMLPLTESGPRLVINAHDITDYRQAQQALHESYADMQRTLRQTIDLIASITEKRDPYTAGHQKRVTELACAIATEMRLAQERIDGIRMAGTVHDLGKINVPADILNKPGRLGDMEMAIVRQHPETAFDILKTIDFPWPVADIVNQHHEREDGSGYPLGLKGPDILPEAKILAVADVVEAMASHRPYRPALGLKQALEEITNNRGRLYDAGVVDACLRLFEKGYQLQTDQ